MEGLSPELLNYIQKSYEVLVLRKQLKELEKARSVELDSMVVEFKVNEANQKREEILSRYRNLMKSLEDQARAIEESL